MIKYVFLFLIFFVAQLNKAQENFFVENKGQIVDQNGKFNSETRYVLSCIGYNVSFYDNHFSYELISVDSNKSESYNINRVEVWFNEKQENSKIISSNEKKNNLNFYKNGEAFLDVRSFGSILYKNVWKGVDIEFFVQDNLLKYNYIISNTADSEIALFIRGAVPKLANGDIVYEYEKGSLLEAIPEVYEIENKQKKEYSLLNVSIEESIIKYSLPNKRNNTVIIDPIAYGEKYATYYGGNNTDYVYSIDHNSNKDIIIGGFTFSASNIATAGAYQTTLSDYDVFIAKFDSLGNRIWGTYYGGPDYDRCYALKVDNNNDIIVTGNTMSISGISTVGTHQLTIGSADDAFVAKFNDLGQLVWGTYYGGDAHDFIVALDYDVSNNIYVTGHTASSNLFLSGTAHNTSLNDTESSFIAGFDASGNILHSSYYGFGTLDEGQGIKCGADGSIYMSGFTSSTSEIAYGVPYQASLQGGLDAFLVKFSSSFQPIWGTYVGGPGEDQSFDLTLDDSLNVYIIGFTSSATQIADVSSYQDTLNSNEDSFIMKFDSTGSRVWGTYFGGEASEYLTAIEIDQSGLWIAGNATSTTGITDSTATNEINNGTYDNIIVHFDKNGNKQWATYLGASLSDYAQDITVIDSSNVFICGFTDSPSLFATDSAHQTVYGGAIDGFWTQICKPLSLTITSLNGDYTLCEGDSLVVNSVNTFASYLWSNGISTPTAVFDTTGKYWLNTLDQNQCPGRSDTIRLEVIPNNDVTITSSGNTICPGDSVIFSVPDYFVSYLWSNLTTTDQQYVLDSGNYWVSTIDTLGCAHNSDTLNLVFSQIQFNLDIIGDTVLCQGESAVLFIAPALSSILWNNGVTSPLQLVDTSGLFWLTAINAQACIVSSDTVQIELLNYEFVLTALDTAGYIEVCVNDTLTLVSDTIFNTYSWSNGATGSFLNVDSAGQYYMNAVDSNGCAVYSDTAEVSFIGTIPTINLLNLDTILCEADTLYFEVQPQEYLDYLWSTGDTLVIAQNSYPVQGVYVVDITVLDSNNCQITRSTSVTIDNCSSIIEQNGVEVSIYPNPAKDYLIINSSSIIHELYLYDFMGKLILNLNVQEEVYYLNVSELPNQVYSLKLITEEGDEVVSKIVVSK